MIPKALEILARDDLEALVANGVSESRSLDYKQAITVGTDREKKEFLADVCALANSGGGDLLYGVAEVRDEQGQPTGVPGAIEGLADVPQGDSLETALGQLIRDAIDPRVNTSIRIIPGFSAGPALVLRVYPSWAAPHMVTFKGTSRFFARGGTGKYQMDVQQIREAFLLSSRIEDDIRRFHDERLALVDAGEIARFPPGPRLVVHSVPFQSVAAGKRQLFGIKDLMNVSNEMMRPFPPGGHSPGPSLDGWRLFSPGFHAEAQIFRNGAIEFVDGEIARQIDGERHLDAIELAREIVQVVSASLKTHEALGLIPPSLLLVSLFAIRGCILHDSKQGFPFRSPQQGRFDRDIRAIIHVLVDDYDADPATIVRPILDTISQAAGYVGSPLYDDLE